MPIHTTLCREGLLYLAVLGFLLAGAITRQINLLMILFGMLAGPLLLSWRMAKASLKQVEIERKLPGSISAGDLLHVELKLTNRRRRLASWALVVGDTIARDDGLARDGGLDGNDPLTSEVLFSYVRAGESRTATYRGRLPRRGRYQFGPLRLSTRFPLGLVKYAFSFDQPDSLVVFPRLGRLTLGWQRWLESAELGLSQTARQQGFTAGEFYGLRDWRSGDSRRWLHWRTSARRQKPVVRQFEQERNQALAVIVELWQPEQAEARHADNVELAVSMAATIVAELCRQGGRWFSLGVAGRQNWTQHGPTSTALLHVCMEQLAMVRPAPDDRLPGVLTEVLDRLRRGTRVLIIGTRAVDLSDPQRFQGLWTESRLRAWQGRILSIDASAAELNEFFIPV
ncbi:MAG TPA: DUF58 domain-containing protein [Pirellulales bacterium]|nr:DUF58 domain-containing protein [Pirellulales bacterium]